MIQELLKKSDMYSKGTRPGWTNKCIQKRPAKIEGKPIVVFVMVVDGEISEIAMHNHMSEDDWRADDWIVVGGGGVTCGCGTVNHERQTKCETCGADISGERQ